MKERVRNLYTMCLRVIPICAGFMLATVVNSTATWAKGQDPLPANAKKYRKF